MRCGVGDLDINWIPLAVLSVSSVTNQEVRQRRQRGTSGLCGPGAREPGAKGVNQNQEPRRASDTPNPGAQEAANHGAGARGRHSEEGIGTMTQEGRTLGEPEIPETRGTPRVRCAETPPP